MNLQRLSCLTFLSRWKRTPLDDAITGGFTFVEKLLRQFGGIEGHRMPSERVALLAIEPHSPPSPSSSEESRIDESVENIVDDQC